MLSIQLKSQFRQNNKKSKFNSDSIVLIRKEATKIAADYIDHAYKYKFNI